MSFLKKLNLIDIPLKIIIMNRKLLSIILVIIILIAGYLVFDSTKENVFIEVHGEEIANSTDVFIVCTITDADGNTIDTNYGKLNIELLEKDGCCGVISEDCPIYHGKSIMVNPNEYDKYNVHYDGGYFFKPADASCKLIIKNETKKHVVFTFYGC